MKKKISIIALLLSVFLLFTGCDALLTDDYSLNPSKSSVASIESETTADYEIPEETPAETENQAMAETPTEANKTDVSGISARVVSLETTVRTDDAKGLQKKVADLNTNKADKTTVSSLLSVVYPNGNTAKTSYIQTYALPAYYIAWENKTAIENLKTSGISATRVVDADGNGILVFKSLSTS